MTPTRSLMPTAPEQSMSAMQRSSVTTLLVMLPQGWVTTARIRHEVTPGHGATLILAWALVAFGDVANPPQGKATGTAPRSTHVFGSARICHRYVKGPVP